jgi:hypothetical protein
MERRKPMAKANPKAWFPNPYDARPISYRSVDKWARYNEQFKPFFDTWKEAHAWMMAKADKRLKKAQSELKSATAHHAKVKAMTEPDAAKEA